MNNNEDDFGISQLDEIQGLINGDDGPQDDGIQDDDFDYNETDGDIVDLSMPDLGENDFEITGQQSDAFSGSHSRIRSIIECLEEVSPILRETINEEQIDQVLGDQAAALYQHVEYIADNLGMDQEKLYDRYLTRRIALILSPIIRKVIDSGLSPEELFHIVQTVHDNTVDEDSAMDMLSRDENSDDVLVAIRLGLMRPAIRFVTLLNSIKADPLMRDSSLRWMHEQAVKLAQDMAINWDRNATLFDREHLFASSVEICAHLCVDSWEGYIAESIEEIPLPAISNEAIWARCESLEAMIGEIPAGYGEHKEYPISDLRAEFGSFLREQLTAYPWENNISKGLRNALRGAILTRIEGIAVFSWQDAFSDIEAKIAEMSEEEFTKWSNCPDNQKPMPFSDFIRKYEEGCFGIANPVEEIEIDFDILSQKTQSVLAILWGFSDAVCTIKHQEE